MLVVLTGVASAQEQGTEVAALRGAIEALDAHTARYSGPWDMSAGAIAAQRDAEERVHRQIGDALHGCTRFRTRNAPVLLARGRCFDLSPNCRREMQAALDFVEAEQTRLNAEAAQVAARVAQENVTEAGTAFEQMTPHDHFLAAFGLLDLNRCEPEVECRSPSEVARHLQAIQGHSDYISTHREPLAAAVQAYEELLQNIARIEEGARARGPQPRPNERGGTYREVRAFLRDHLNDPRSYQAVACGVPRMMMDRWDVECSFRARNAFGALVLQTWVFGFQQGRITTGGAAEDE